MYLERLNDGKKIQIQNTSKPKFTSTKGATWDIGSKIIIDDISVEMYCDTTWGMYTYFNYNEKWYKAHNYENGIWLYECSGKFTMKRGKVCGD